ncbi:MAG: hypothetical protein H0T62_10330 [Parachlamydiaceae bacterium]|nr:hypothetical protein [Parachlamydiaceae bacterium]
MLAKPIFTLSLFVLVCVVNRGIHAETFNGPTVLSEQSFEELIIIGPADLKNIRAESLTVTGPLKFHRIEVSGKTTVTGPMSGLEGNFENVIVNGPFRAKKLKIRTLDVTGPAALARFTFLGDAKINGPLEAKHGHFQNLKAGSEEGGKSISFYDVTAKNMTVRRGKKEEIITLAGRTEITGEITFESEKGRIETIGNNVKVKESVQN